jgi:hypothetical protein
MAIRDRIPPVSNSKRAPSHRKTTLALLAIGLLARIAILGLAPRYGYVWDHFDNIGMGRTAVATGLVHVYSVAKEDLSTVHGRIWRNGAFETVDRRAIIAPNYPPLAITIFLLQSSAIDALQRPLTANTVLARTLMASVPIAFEWMMAIAAGAIAARLFGERRRTVALGLTWLFPPIFLNSCLWGQVDAFFLGPAAIAALLLLDRRWAAAGLAVGVAVLLKPQGLLLLPLAAFGAFMVEKESGGEFSRVLRRCGVILGSAAGVVVVATLPWTVADGFAWVRRSYVVSFLTAFPDTTLYAFNVWYADLLRLDGRPVFALDSRALLLGIPKDIWGRALFSTASAGILWFCWKRIRPRSIGFVYGAGMLLWSAFIFPTRVHERFILYAMPFVIVLAVEMRRLRPALLVLLVVGIAEQSWNLWITGPPAGALINRPQVESRLAKLRAEPDAAQLPGTRRPTQVDAVASLAAEARTVLPSYLRARRATRPWEILFTFLSLAGYLAAWVGRPRSYSPKNSSIRST